MGTAAFAPCPSCGKTINSVLTICPFCKADVVVELLPEPDTAGSLEEMAEDASPAPMPERAPVLPSLPPAADQYRPLRSHAAALQVMFAAWMVLAAVAMGANILLIRWATRLNENPLAVGYDALQAADHRAFRLNLVEMAAEIVIAILFIAWMKRGYRNIKALGVNRSTANGGSSGDGSSRL